MDGTQQLGETGQAPNGPEAGETGQAPNGQEGQAPNGQEGQAPSGQEGQAPSGQEIQWCLVCPEVELGLGVPREPIELYRDGDGIALRTVHSARELGDAMRGWCEQKLQALEALGLCGFVLRARSPSCGVGNVPIYRDDENLEYGDGLFAAALRRRWPDLPLILDEELSDPQRAAAFLQAARAYAEGAPR